MAKLLWLVRPMYNTRFRYPKVATFRGVLDISLGGEVQPGLSYPDPPLFKTEFLFLIPCLRHLTQTPPKNCCSLVRRTYAQAVYGPRKDTLFKTIINKIDSLIKAKKRIKSIPCLIQKSRKTYPGWPHITPPPPPP